MVLDILANLKKIKKFRELTGAESTPLKKGEKVVAEASDRIKALATVIRRGEDNLKKKLESMDALRTVILETKHRKKASRLLEEVEVISKEVEEETDVGGILADIMWHEIRAEFGKLVDKPENFQFRKGWKIVCVPDDQMESLFKAIFGLSEEEEFISPIEEEMLYNMGPIANA